MTTEDDRFLYSFRNHRKAGVEEKAYLEYEKKHKIKHDPEKFN